MLLSRAMNYGRVWKWQSRAHSQDTLLSCEMWCVYVDLVCVCVLIRLFSPWTPQFIVSLTHWHQSPAKPFQTYRCTTKQRAGCMMLVHMRGIPDVSGGQQHKTWGKSSRQTDVRCRMCHPVAPTGRNEFKVAQLKSLQAKRHNRWIFALHPVSKWRQDSLESEKLEM